MDSSNTEKVYNRAYDQAFATGGKQSDWIKAGVEAVAEWRDAEVAELERQIQGWVKAATEAKDAHRAEVGVLREQLAAAEAVIADAAKALRVNRLTVEAWKLAYETLSASPSVVLEDRDRENRAIGWDEGYEAGYDDEGFNARGLSTDSDADEHPHSNPYRGDKK